MRTSPFFANVLLSALLGILLLVAVIARTFAPQLLFPKLNIPAMAALSLITLLLRHYLAPQSSHRYSIGALFGALTFAILPWSCAFLSLGDALRTGAAGGIVFTATAWLFAAIEQRLADSDTSPAAPIICALGLYLAAQGFMGILL